MNEKRKKRLLYILKRLQEKGYGARPAEQDRTMVRMMAIERKLLIDHNKGARKNGRRNQDTKTSG